MPRIIKTGHHAVCCVVPLIGSVFIAGVLTMSGCASHSSLNCDQDGPVCHHVSATRITEPVGCDLGDVSRYQAASISAPQTLTQHQQADLRDITLQEAVRSTLLHSQVFRDLGGTVLRSADGLNSIHSPALLGADPRFGVEGALSAFDANFTSRLMFENNDRPLNNLFFGGGTRQLQQDYGVLNTALTKRTAFGTQMTARHLIEYDFNNATGNANPNLPWQTYVDLELRQPLLNGAGAEINRIAGPNATPGVYNGVLIARIREDVSLAEFEVSVTSLVRQVETAYWELYFAYRNLEARRDARDRALETWRLVKAFDETGRRGGDPATEARAREQYYRLEADVQNALAGRSADSNTSDRFRGDGGIYVKERQLRLMMGLPINDGVVLNPVTEPSLAEVCFDWNIVLQQSLTDRPELRRQKWKIRQRELELCAARHQLKPQLDMFTRYRWRGLGHDLLDPSGSGGFDNAFQNLTSGNYQEWQVGLEYAIPIGMRQAHSAVTHAMLSLSRERAVLDEQHREVSLQLSNAIAEKDRSYELVQTNLNRRIAAQDHVEATAAVYEGADENQKARLLDVLLDAQRRLSEAEVNFQISCVEYMLSITQVHAAQGSLLAYNEVYLSEGPWPHKAYHDAGDRINRREFTPEDEDHIHRGPVLSVSSHD
ncbi:MAG: TolC family protein [Planctomycetaceae bacterium]